MTRKALILAIGVSLLLIGCSASPEIQDTDSPEPQEAQDTSTLDADSSESMEEGDALTPCDPSDRSASIAFEYEVKVDASLPDEWRNEFDTIFEVLQSVTPVSHCISTVSGIQTPFPVFAWSSAAPNPWPEFRQDLGGACICGDGVNTWMALEITAEEFEYDSLHRYSVIAHEYFHLYQISVSSNKMANGGLAMWLVEGGAKVFEELYLQQHFGKSELDRNLFPISFAVISSPEILETYDRDYSLDVNYNSSAFLVLALVDFLQETQGISEERALEMALFDISAEMNIESDWRLAFANVFGVTVNDFYATLEKYPSMPSPEPWVEVDVVDGAQVMPSEGITLESIFVAGT